MTAGPAEAVTTSAERRPRVLIIDDDDVVRGLLQDICEEHGWDAVADGTAADGILSAGLQHIDLILLDFHLHDGGNDLLAPLRALRTICPTTPIVVVTGQEPESLAAAVSDAGGEGVVGKPCSVAQVAALLDRYRPVSAGARLDCTTLRA